MGFKDLLPERKEASLLLQAAGQEPGPQGEEETRKEQRAELSRRELGFMQRSGREGGRGQSSKK